MRWPPKKNLIINRGLSGGYCKTAVSGCPSSQIKIKMRSYKKELEEIANDLLNQKSSFKNNKNLLWKSSQTGTAFNLEATIKL